MKVCRTCQVEKPLNQFPVVSKNRDGLDSWCRECKKAYDRAYYLANKERIKGNVRRYRENNPDKVKASQRKYREDNREYLREQSREYRINNIEKVRKSDRRYRAENIHKLREADREYYKKNSDVIKAYQKEYAKDNPEKISRRGREYRAKNKAKLAQYFRRYREKYPERKAAYRRNRRARKKNAEGSHTPDDILHILELQDHKCNYCITRVRDSYHVDHIIALMNGGTNWPSNLQILCPSCNLSKGAKCPVEFAIERNYPLLCSYPRHETLLLTKQ